MPFTASISLLASLEHHAARDPGHPCVIDVTGPGAPRTWTYAEALNDVCAVAGGLARIGVEPGDRVAMRLANSWSFVAGLLGALAAGAVAVPTIRQYATDELRYALADSGARCLIFDDEDPAPVLAALPEGTVGVSTRAAGASAELTLDELRDGEPAPGRPIDGAADAVIFYTSGTTGRPKGVVLTHAAIVESCLINADGWRLRPDDRAYVVLPLFHCNALFMQLVPLLLAGATAVLDDRFSASGYLDTLRRHEITLANLTAGAIRSVLAQPERDDDREHRVRMMTFGLPLHAEESERLWQRFGIPAYMCYGLTESSAGGTRTPLHRAPHRGWQSLGVAQPGWRVAVLDEEGREVPPGTLGEIVLRGPGVLDRYWNRPDATAQALRDGWLHTGDLGSLDEGGYLTFHSRQKDMLKPKGENVAASEVEDVLDRHPAVVESAVVGVFDPHQEERIIAFMAGDPDLGDADELRRHCQEHLARFKVPSEFHWVQDLPRTSIGKVNKGRLRERLAAIGDEHA
jgi:crotonobetaine/carnitine-CoA ligase